MHKKAQEAKNTILSAIEDGDSKVIASALIGVLGTVMNALTAASQTQGDDYKHIRTSLVWGHPKKAAASEGMALVPIKKLEIQARHYRDTAKLIESRGYEKIDATDQMHAWLMAATKTEAMISAAQEGK